MADFQDFCRHLPGGGLGGVRGKRGAGPAWTGGRRAEKTITIGGRAPADGRRLPKDDGPTPP
jgi:hypothetical protein